MGIPNLVLRVHVKDQSAFPSSGMRHASVLWSRGSPLFKDILCAGAAGAGGGQPVYQIVGGETASWPYQESDNLSKYEERRLRLGSESDKVFLQWF